MARPCMEHWAAAADLKTVPQHGGSDCRIRAHWNHLILDQKQNKVKVRAMWRHHPSSQPSGPFQTGAHCQSTLMPQPGHPLCALPAPHCFLATGATAEFPQLPMWQFGGCLSLLRDFINMSSTESKLRRKVNLVGNNDSFLFTKLLTEIYISLKTTGNKSQQNERYLDFITSKKHRCIHVMSPRWQMS